MQIEPSSFSVSESAPVSSVVGVFNASLDGAVNSSIAISLTGGAGGALQLVLPASDGFSAAEIQVAALLDFESVPSYVLSVLLQLDGHADVTDSVLVAVTDEAEPPQWLNASAAYSIPHNQAAPHALLPPAVALNPAPSAAVCGFVGPFVPDQAAFQALFGVDTTNTAGQSTCTVQLLQTLSSTAGINYSAGMNISNTAGWQSLPLLVQVLPPPPAVLLNASTLAIAVSESTPPPLLIGPGIGATAVPDGAGAPDCGLAPPYTPSETAVHAAFHIVTESPGGVDASVCRVQLVTALDAEGTGSYVFRLRANTTSAEAFADVTVSVTNVNEPPVVQSAAVELPENTGPGVLVAQLTGSDPEGSPLVFELERAPPVFELEGAGGLLTRSNISAVPESAASISFEALSVAAGQAAFRDVSQAGAAAGWAGSFSAGYQVNVSLRFLARAGGLPSNTGTLFIAVLDLDEAPLTPLPSVVGPPAAAWGGGDPPLDMPTLYLLENSPGARLAPSAAAARAGGSAAAPPLPCFTPDLAAGASDCGVEEVLLLPRSAQSIMYTYDNRSLPLPMDGAGIRAVAASCGGGGQWGALWLNASAPVSACRNNSVTTTPYAQTLALHGAALTDEDLPAGGSQLWLGEHTPTAEPRVCFQTDGAPPFVASIRAAAPCQAANYEARTEYHVLFRSHSQRRPTGPRAWVLARVRVVDAPDPTTLRAAPLVAAAEDLAPGTNIDGSELQVTDEDAESIQVRLRPGAAGDPCNVLQYVPDTIPRKVDGTRDAAYLQLRPGQELPNAVFSCEAQALNGTGAVLAATSVTVTVEDLNDPPVPAQLLVTGSVAENTPGGTVVAVLNATDADLRQNLTFTVTNELSSVFSVLPLLNPSNNSAPGAPAFVFRSALLLLRADNVDYEAMAARNFTYTVPMRVSDTPFLRRSDGSFARDTTKISESADFTVQLRVLDMPDEPVITQVRSLSPYGLSTAGSDFVELRGQNLGSGLPAHPDVPFRINAVLAATENINITQERIVEHIVSSCSAFSWRDVTVFLAQECVVTEAHTAVQCRVPPGFGEGHHWGVVLGGLLALPQGAQPLLYDPQVPLALQPQTLWPQTRSQFQSCDGVVQPAAPSSPMCAPDASARACPPLPQPPPPLAPPGSCPSTAGSTVRTCARLTQFSGWSTNTTAYGSPSVVRVEGSGARAAATRGGQQVLITGTNFALSRFDAVTDVTYGAQGTGFTAQQCNMTRDHAELVCFTGAGVGSALQWQVSVATLSSAVPSTSYAAPSVQAVFTAVRFANGTLGPLQNTSAVKLSTGGDASRRLVIFGDNFGAGEGGGRLLALAPPSGVVSAAQHPWSSAGELASASGRWLQSALPVAAVSVALQSPLTGQRFTVSDCSTRQAFLQIECALPQAVGQNLSVEVQVGGLTSELSRGAAAVVQFHPPLITPSLRTIPVLGTRVDILGTNFTGTIAGVATQVFFGSQLFSVETPCSAAGCNVTTPSPPPERLLSATAVTDVSFREVRFDAPPGERSNVPLRVVVGGQSSNTVTSYSYLSSTEALHVKPQLAPQSSPSDQKVYVQMQSARGKLQLSACCWALRVVAAHTAAVRNTSATAALSTVAPCFAGDSFSDAQVLDVEFSGDANSPLVSTSAYHNALRVLEGVQGGAAQCQCSSTNPHHIQVQVLNDGGTAVSSDIVAVLDSGSELLVVARICRVLGSQLRISAGGTPLGVTEGGYDYFNSADAPVVERWAPPRPLAGGGVLRVFGRNFRELRGTLFLREYLVCGTGQRREMQLPVAAWGLANATISAEAGWFEIVTTLPPAPPGARRQLAVRVQSENATANLESSEFGFEIETPLGVQWAQASGPTQGFQFAGEEGNLAPGDAPLLTVTLPGAAAIATQPCSTPANNPSPLAVGSAPVSGVPSFRVQDASQTWPLRVRVGSGVRSDAVCRIVRVQDGVVHCRAPAGQHDDAALSVQVYARGSADDSSPWRDLGAGSSVTYSFNKPTLQAVTLSGRALQAGGVTLGPTAGGAQRVLRGSSLGSSSGQLRLTGADGASTPLEVQQWNHTHATVEVEPGVGGWVRLVAVAADCTGTSCSSEPLLAAYDAPEVTFLQEVLVVATADQQAPTSNRNGSTVMLNARETGVLVTGLNFGEVDLSNNSVSLGGQPCVPAEGETVRQGDDTLECTLRDIPVGPLNMSIAVAGQRLFLPATATRAEAECRAGFFGLVPGVDRCQPCPSCTTSDCDKLGQLAASVCVGGGQLPQASPGFWRTDAFAGVSIVSVDVDSANSSLRRVTFALSVGAFQLITDADSGGALGIQRSQIMTVPASDPRPFQEQAAAFLASQFGSSVRYSFTRCEPAEACLGDNVCRTGYEGAACSLCIAGEYQRDFLTNTCRPCPPEPLLNFVGILVGVLIAALVLYKLYQKGPSVAALSIAVDYLQIISVFGTLNLEWPPVLLQVFRIAAASAASVDTASPDCAVAIGYIPKWYFQMLLPVIVAVVFMLLHIFMVLGKFLKRRKLDFKSLTKHSDKMLGSWLLMCSFLYIALTAKAFEALSCQQVAAKPVLVADPAISCDSADYLAMRQWAIFGVFVYGLGIPMFFGTLIYMYGARMKVDQALRIRNLAGSRDTNPFYDMSKRYRRLYFKFKPEYHFWILLILARKFLIVASTFVLQRRPVMAATVITVVLFGSVMLQMLNNPYRSHNSEKKQTEAAAAKQQPSTPVPPPKRSAEQRTDNPLQAAKAGGVTPLPPKGIAGLIAGRGVRFREEDLLNDDSHMFANDPQVTAAAVAAQAKRLKAEAGGRFAKRGLTVNGRTRGDSLFARMASIAQRGSPTGSKRHPVAAGRLRAESKLGPQSRQQPGASLGVRPRRMATSQTPAQPRAEQEQHGSLSGACSCCPCGVVERLCDALYSCLCGGRCCVRVMVAAGCGRSAPRATPLRLASSSALRQNAIKATAGSATGTALGKRRYSLVGALGTRHINASHAAAGSESPYAWMRRQCISHCPCCKSQSLSDLQLRAEARTGGKTKIKLKYVFDYNRLEATFLCCAIFVLLSGVMFKSVDCDIASDTTVGVDGDVAVGEAGAGSSTEDADVERATLQAVVLVLIAISTAICIATVAAEMWLGFRYFLLAGKARRQAEREHRRALTRSRSGVSSTKLLSPGGGDGSPKRGAHEEQPEAGCLVQCSSRASRALALTCSACVRMGAKCSCRCRYCQACAERQGPTPQPDSDEDNGDIELTDKTGRKPVFMTTRQRAISRAIKSAQAHVAEDEEEDGAAMAWAQPEMQAKLAAMSGYSQPEGIRGRSSSKDPAALLPTSPGMYRPQRDATGAVSVRDVALRRTAVIQRLAALQAKSSDISKAEQAALKVVNAREGQAGGGGPPHAPPPSSALAHTAVAAAHYGLLKSSSLPPEALRTLETLSKAEAYQKLHAAEQRAKWANTPLVGGLLRSDTPPAGPTPGEDVQRRPGSSTVSTASATVTSGGRVHVDSPLRALALVGDPKHGRLASASSVPLDPRSSKGKAMKLPKDVGRVVGVTSKDLSKRVARYAFSVHLGRAAGLPASVPQGASVTLTLRKDQSKERVLFTYRSGQHVRCREMSLLVVDPAVDVVHGTLSLDSRGRSGASVVRSEQLIGTFAIPVGDFQLANPTRDEHDGSREPLAGRREVQCELRNHLGESTGRISLFCRLQHRGVALDDWTAMQLGARDFSDIAAPSHFSAQAGSGSPPRTLVAREDAGGITNRGAIGVRDAQDFDSADILMQGETPVRRSARAQRSMTWHRSQADSIAIPPGSGIDLPEAAPSRASVASRLSILPKKRHPRGSIAFQIVQNEEGRNVAVPFRNMSAVTPPGTTGATSPGAARQQLPSNLSSTLTVDAAGRSSMVNPLVMAATMDESHSTDEGAMRRRFSMQRARVATPEPLANRSVLSSDNARARRSLQVQMHGSMREQLGRLKAYSSVSRLDVAAEAQGSTPAAHQKAVGLGLLEENSQSGEDSDGEED